MEKLAAQENLELWEEPTLLLTDLEKKSNQIQSALRRIILDSSKQKTKSTTSRTTTKMTSSTESVLSPKPKEYIGVDDEESTSTTTATVTSTIAVADQSSSISSTIGSTMPAASPDSERKHEEL